MIRRSYVLLIVLLCFLVAGQVWGQRRINLPLENSQASIEDADHEALRAFFEDFNVADTSALNEPIEKILHSYFPTSYDSGCGEMIGYWGSDPANVPGTMLRVVFVNEDESSQAKHILLAYRCFSYRDYYRDKYYDERLAALTIGEDQSSLALLPHLWDCKKTTALTKVSVGQRYQTGGVPLVSMVFSIAGDNPCCNGSFDCDETRIVYYLFEADVVKPVASVMNRKEEYYSDYDSETVVIYEADIWVEENADGEATEIISAYTIKEKEEIREEGTLRYLWNETTRVFEEGIE